MALQTRPRGVALREPGQSGRELVCREALRWVAVLAALRPQRHARCLRAEQKVGRILDGLAASGWLTLHDLAGGRGKIDHIAVGPSGVFAIETKSQRGRVCVERISRRWLSQAYTERRHLEDLTGIRIDPLLVFSDADIVGQPVSRRRGVLVLPARMLAGHLSTRQTILTGEQVRERYARIVSALSAG